MTTDRRKHIIKILVLIVSLLCFCNAFLQMYNWQHEGIKTLYLASIFFLSILWVLVYGFAIGALTAFIPFKKLNYKQKYLPNALACTIVIGILFALSAIRSIYYTKYLYNF